MKFGNETDNKRSCRVGVKYFVATISKLGDDSKP
jgi:hypothetical protein